MERTENLDTDRVVVDLSGGEPDVSGGLTRGVVPDLQHEDRPRCNDPVHHLRILLDQPILVREDTDPALT